MSHILKEYIFSKRFCFSIMDPNIIHNISSKGHRRCTQAHIDYIDIFDINTGAVTVYVNGIQSLLLSGRRLVF